MEYASLQTPLLNSAGNPVVLTLEVVVRTGIPEFSFSGIAPSRARDITERVVCALQMNGIRLKHRNVTLHAEGQVDRHLEELLDLPVAVVLLKALGYSLPGLSGAGQACLGKLSLDGSVRRLLQPGRMLSVAGTLEFHTLTANYPDQIVTSFGSAAPVNLTDVASMLESQKSRDNPSVICIGEGQDQKQVPPFSLKNRNYNWVAMRAAVASAGARHSMLCMGPPGSGKTTLAHLIYEMLPLPDSTECREIFLRMNGSEKTSEVHRPFRRPHHSITRVAMIGGGSPVKVGETTEANHGMLLLDELGEFRREVLQSLREPLDSQKVHIARGAQKEQLPCIFWFMATANACPCGMAGSSEGICQCNAGAIRQYQARMLGALQDRMDIELFLESDSDSVSRELVLEWYQNLLNAQEQRYRQSGVRYNSEIEDWNFCAFNDQQTEDLFCAETSNMSNRKSHRIRRLARSIADMSGAAWIQMAHILEALRYTYSDWNSISQENAKAPSRYG